MQADAAHSDTHDIDRLTTAVHDLLLGFTLRRPDARLLDPACGQGGLLASAAQWHAWWGHGRTADNILWGIDTKPAAPAPAQTIAANFFTLDPDTTPVFDAIVSLPPPIRAARVPRIDAPDRNQLPLFTEPVEAAPALRLPQTMWSRLHGRSGLHAFYLLHATDFLRENGRVAVVVPNGWLDVAHGRRFKQFLLDHYRLLAIVESRVEQWLPDSRLQSCLLVLEKCSGPQRRAANRVRLAQLQRPLTDLLWADSEDSRRVQLAERLVARLLAYDSRHDETALIQVLNQGELDPADRWGARLRAPQLDGPALQAETLLPLSAWAVVQRGHTTGANHFFYLDDDTVAKWQIEADYLRPLLKTLRHADRLSLPAAAADAYLLDIPAKADLAGTAVARYVAWGEEQGLHLRATCASRQPWYALPPQPPARLVLPKGVWRRHLAPLLAAPLQIDQQIYRFDLAANVPLTVAAALLNSSWFALQCERHGRVHLGRGLLWLAGYELAQIGLPDPRSISVDQAARLTDSFSALSAEPVADITATTVHPAREALDTAVYDLLHFSAAQRRQAAEELHQRAVARLTASG